MAESHRCPHGEDLAYIAAACATADFSHVLNGIVDPEYLSPAGSDVIEWIVSKRSEGRAAWPPSYEVVQSHFPSLDWPSLPEDKDGLDVRFAVRDVLYTEKTSVCTEATARIHTLMKLDFADPNFEHLVQETEDRIRIIKNINTPTPRAARMAEDPDITFGEIVGEHGSQKFAKFKMYFDESNRIHRPFEEGMYCRFARPKNGKSWLEEADALHWGITMSEPAILADQENSKVTLQTRIACLYGGISYAAVREIRLKRVEGVALTPHEKRVYEKLYDTITDIAEKSNLILYGKEQINPETGRLSLDKILAESRDIGAAAVFIEQIHKIDCDGVRRSASDTERIHRVVQRLADTPIISVVTTQEKRFQDKKAKKKQLIEPADDWVFGGDAVAQNCSYLGHLQKVDLPDGSAIIVETPVIARNSYGNERFFIATDFCENFTILPQAEGEAIVQSVFEAERASKSDSEGGGGGGGGGAPPSLPPAPSAARPVTKWLS